MKPSHLASFAQDCWIQTAGEGSEVHSAVTGGVVAHAQSLEFAAMALAFGHSSTKEKDVVHA